MKDARIRRGEPAVASRFCKNISSSFISSGSTPARVIRVQLQAPTLRIKLQQSAGARMELAGSGH